MNTFLCRPPASCSIRHGPATPPRAGRHRRSPPPCPSATGSPDPLRASSPSRTATPVSPPPLPACPPPQRRHHAACPRGAAARSTPRCTSARTRPVPREAGWGWAIAAPTAIPWGFLVATAVRRRSVLETLGPLWHGQRASVERIVRVMACAGARRHAPRRSRSPLAGRCPASARGARHVV
jgi:hypothetical protein